MAGFRLVMNEHWGMPNSLWPGSLWWEHTQLLKCKPISAGWKAKKTTPWKPCHELLQISVTAHVKDGFCIHCSHEDLDTWAASATIADFNAVAAPHKVKVSRYTWATYRRSIAISLGKL
ncbi:hypothetical protein B0H13DRAFT_2553859 [Mycena leptocephala]|nr:hypothetical protein B0H13DRAFT_2553859 [Mycena leptocephala]